MPFKTALGEMLKPYKVGKIRRAPEICVVFDGALEYSTTYQVWHVVSEVPVGNGIDNVALTTTGSGAPYLLDNYTGTTKLADDSVDMTFRNGRPNSDEGSAANSMSNFRFRHVNDTVCNSLMADGHVEAFTFNKRLPANDKNVTTLRRRNIYVNPVPQ